MKSKKIEYKTFEQHAMDKLREIEPATRKQWALARGFNTRNAFQSIIKRCLELKLIEINEIRKPYIISTKK